MVPPESYKVTSGSSNFDIKREISRMRLSAQSSSSFYSSRKKSHPPPRPPRPSHSPPLEVVVEEVNEPVEEVFLTPVYQRRRRCVAVPQTIPSVDLGHPECYSSRRASLTEFQPSRQALGTVWEVEPESELLDTRESRDLTVGSRDEELLTPPDSPLRIIQSGSYARSKTDYAGNTEKFEKIMERVKQLRRETSDLEWGKALEEESREPQCNGEHQPVSNNA